MVVESSLSEARRPPFVNSAVGGVRRPFVVSEKLVPVANHLCPSSSSEMSPLGPVGVHTPQLESSRTLSSSSEVHVSSSEGAYAQKPVDKELSVGKQLCKGF